MSTNRRRLLAGLIAAPAALSAARASASGAFHHQGGVIPEPLFDTQIAAMVCGFGESASYETLVRKLAKADIDKSARFTDWSRRPLSKRQLEYALADVTYLRLVYETLSKELQKTGRAKWVEEEEATLNRLKAIASEFEVADEESDENVEDEEETTSTSRR